MDLVEFEFTKKKAINKVYSLYLEGYSTQDIRILTRFEDKTIDNIIDCCNYFRG